MPVKKILVVCGTAGITSTIAEQEIQAAARAAGIQVQTMRCTPGAVATRAHDVDFIVTTTALGSHYGVPIINGMAFITGIGKEQVIEEILNRLRDND